MHVVFTDRLIVYKWQWSANKALFDTNKQQMRPRRRRLSRWWVVACLVAALVPVADQRSTRRRTSSHWRRARSAPGARSVSRRAASVRRLPRISSSRCSSHTVPCSGPSDAALCWLSPRRLGADDVEACRWRHDDVSLPSSHLSSSFTLYRHQL